MHNAHNKQKHWLDIDVIVQHQNFWGGWSSSASSRV